MQLEEVEPDREGGKSEGSMSSPKVTLALEQKAFRFRSLGVVEGALSNRHSLFVLVLLGRSLPHSLACALLPEYQMTL